MRDLPLFTIFTIICAAIAIALILIGALMYGPDLVGRLFGM